MRRRARSVCERRSAPRSTSRSKFIHPIDRNHHVQTCIALALVAALGVQSTTQQPLVGYTPTNAAHERELESNAIKRPSPTFASAHSRELSKETHVAGTPAQARTRDYVIA